jgi:hypothetical protein
MNLIDCLCGLPMESVGRGSESLSDRDDRPVGSRDLPSSKIPW